MRSNSYVATLQNKPDPPPTEPTRHPIRSPPHRASQHHSQQFCSPHSRYHPLPHQHCRCPSPQRLPTHEEYSAAPLTSSPLEKLGNYHNDTETRQDSLNPPNQPSWSPSPAQHSVQQ